MPYKNIEDRKANNKLRERVRQIRYWTALGFNIMDENNPKSDVQCNECGKLSGRKAAHMFRHHEHCIYYRKPKTWVRTQLKTGLCNTIGRKHRFDRRGFCVMPGCTRHKNDADNARRRNVQLIAERRRKRKLETVSD